MNMQDDIRRIIDYFKDRDEISTLYIFGSAANGKETAESDIDIRAEGHIPYSLMQMRLQNPSSQYTQECLRSQHLHHRIRAIINSYISMK
jgi:predicted nucleotidyltransferase